MRAATLFSGIGAPEQARPDWHWLWHAEVEPFPAAVLAARHPGSINLGDVTADDFAERAERVGRPDVLVFGSPCQSFSVAGKRLGLSDPRGNLALVALALVGRLRPRWFVFENVPGLLSSDDGDDFAAFVGAVAECGYSGCWRVLDARYWHLAQRRERVFFVGSLGDWRGPAAVLSLAEGLRGYPEKGGEAGEDVVGAIGARTCSSIGAQDAEAGHLLSMCLNAHPNRSDAETPTFIAHTLRADSFDASEDGTGRGTPLVPVAFNLRGRDGGAMPEMADLASVRAASGGSSRSYVAWVEDDDAGTYEADASSVLSTLRAQVGAEAVAEWGSRILDSLQAPEVLRAWLHGESIRRASDTFRRWVDDRPLSRAEDSAARTLRKVWENGPDGRSSQGRGLAKQLARQLGTPLPQLPRAWASEPRSTAVRRLTPTECERLMGFPDGYTAIQWRGKPAADGPRYKALGNSMAVPVLRWLLTRIEAHDAALRVAA